jgi:hypothetical protein
MSWTYTGKPADVPRDAVRFLIGDTDHADQLLYDAEISYLLTEEGGNVKAAAAKACYAIAGKFARKATQKSVGDLSISYAQRQQQYIELAEKLEASVASSAVSPYAGGISVSDIDSNKADDDRPASDFERGHMDGESLFPTTTRDDD